MCMYEEGRGERERQTDRQIDRQRERETERAMICSRNQVVAYEIAKEKETNHSIPLQAKLKL